jgi:hypothetical protein
MDSFPRTRIEDLSVSRLVIGTNWFLGYSHTSKARDALIDETVDARRIADIVETFLKAGVDTLYGMRATPKLVEGVAEAEQRTGRACIRMAIPSLPLEEGPQARGEAERILDEMAGLGVAVCLPHQMTTDAFVNRRTRSLQGIEPYLAMIRERGMIPGLSTHMPETPGYADAQGLDVATYIQIYNAAGFLMQVEVDWVHRIIWKARHPVIVIKPLAAGRLHPLVGLAFAWSTLREQDMVCVGTFSPREAEEVLELSSSLLEQRAARVALQQTRSKQHLSAESVASS